MWNYQHDWVNLLFNLDLRNAHSHFEFRKPLLYIACIIYLYSPIFVYYIFKKIKTLWRSSINTTFSLFIITAFIPILFFGTLSFTKVIGLHWLFSAYPFLFMGLFALLNIKEIKQCAIFMAVYTLIQLIIVVIAFNLPLSFWKKTPIFSDVNWFLHYHQIEPNIQPYLDKGFILLTPSYSQSYLLAYKQKRKAAVWGTGSVHGRQDDLSSDFKDFAGKNILIVDINKKLKTGSIKPYFKKLVTKTLTLNGMPYPIFLGYNFDYALYRDKILRKIYEKYYQAPKYLPRSRAYFKEKYDF